MPVRRKVVLTGVVLLRSNFSSAAIVSITMSNVVLFGMVLLKKCAQHFGGVRPIGDV